MAKPHIAPKEELGTPVQDNRAVGNSRLAHMDVLSVSGTGVPGSSALGRPSIANEFAPASGVEVGDAFGLGLESPVTPQVLGGIDGDALLDRPVHRRQ